MIGGPRPVRATIVGMVLEGYDQELIVYRVAGGGWPLGDGVRRREPIAMNGHPPSSSGCPRTRWTR